MEVSQAYITSTAEVFEEISVSCLIYPCIGTASFFQPLTSGIEKHCQRLRKPRQRKLNEHLWCHLLAKVVEDNLTRQAFDSTWV